MELYDEIGKDYANTRKADPRITNALIDSLDLPPNSKLLDAGAGTGKYSFALAEAGFEVFALEPSEVMRRQGVKHQRVRFIAGSVDEIPLSDDSVDGAIVVLAMHHFKDQIGAMRELLRVVNNGPIVFYTFDPARVPDFWLSEYFPEVGKRFESYTKDLPSLVSTIGSELDIAIDSKPFLLPPDLEDKFGAAMWAKPEAYLDPEVRRGISDFTLLDPDSVKFGLEKLSQDLKSGEWDRKHGELRNAEAFDAGYRILKVDSTPKTN